MPCRCGPEKLTATTGVVKLPILGESNHANFMVMVRDFPYNSALFGMVIK